MPQKKRKRPVPHERPYVSDLELAEVLRQCLTDRELNALERQIRRAVEKATEQACKMAVEETHTRDWAIIMRVLRDRFGFGVGRITKLWDSALEYLHDMDDGLISAKEMLETLENEDGIRITWEASLGDK